MKKVLFTLIALISITIPAWADICSDTMNSYAANINRLTQDYLTASGMTADPEEKASLAAGYAAQKAQLEAERDATLAAMGCNNTTSNPDPVPTPTPGVTPTPTPGNGD